MTNGIATNLQLQEVENGRIELFDLTLPDGTVKNFIGTLEADYTTVHFRDSKSPYTLREYSALPIMIDGLDITTDGAMGRPSLTMANIGTFLTNELSPYSFKDLIGQKIVRRQTLKQYLYEPTDTNTTAVPPVEFQQSSFRIDRISAENNLMIEFSLAVAYDLENIVLPRRSIIGKYCTWIYQGEELNKTGGCTWDSSSKLDYTYVTGTDTQNPKTSNFYFTADDNPIVSQSWLTTNATAWSSSSSYTTNSYVYKDDVNFNFSALQTNGLADKRRKYYVSSFGTSGSPQSGNTPTVTSSFWKQAFPYVVYNSGDTYSTNEHVRFTITVLKPIEITGGVDTVWKALGEGTLPAPASISVFWTRGDICGKRLASCKCRYQVIPAEEDADNSAPAGTFNTTQVLQFGGFPGTARFT